MKQPIKFLISYLTITLALSFPAEAMPNFFKKLERETKRVVSQVKAETGRVAPKVEKEAERIAAQAAREAERIAKQAADLAKNDKLKRRIETAEAQLHALSTQMSLILGTKAAAPAPAPAAAATSTSTASVAPTVATVVFSEERATAIEAQLAALAARFEAELARQEAVRRATERAEAAEREATAAARAAMLAATASSTGSGGGAAPAADKDAHKPAAPFSSTTTVASPAAEAGEEAKNANTRQLHAAMEASYADTVLHTTTGTPMTAVPAPAPVPTPAPVAAAHAVADLLDPREDGDEPTTAAHAAAPAPAPAAAMDDTIAPPTGRVQPSVDHSLDDPTA